MHTDQTLTIIIRLLEDCLEEEQLPEEIRDKLYDILRLIEMTPVETGQRPVSTKT